MGVRAISLSFRIRDLEDSSEVMLSRLFWDTSRETVHSPE
jgi:hypothetical protein